MATDYQKAVRNADRVFSIYIRMRDADDNGYCKCISCGRVRKWNDGTDAGHFINRAWTSVRYSEDNVHAQCSYCNRFQEGEQAKYSIALLDKIGKERLKALECCKGKRKIPIYELIEIKKHYQQKIKDLKKVKVFT